MGITAYQFGGGVAGLQLLNGVNLSASLTAIADKNNTPSFLKLSTSNISLEAPTFLSLLFQQTLGTRIGFSASQTVNVPSAGNGVFRMISNAYTINNLAAQTGSITGFYLNATETALNGITHNLMDLQVGGVSRFLVGTNGAITCFGNSSIPVIKMSAINDFTNAVSIFLFSATTGRTIFGGDRFQLNGTTSSFPAIKRNGAAIDFRLADDSAFCNINANGINISTGNIELNQTQCIISNVGAGTTGLQVRANGSSSVALDVLGSSTITNNIQRWRTAGSVTLAFIDGTGGAMFGGTSKDASAILQADSTTKGFLPPRMTTTQINAIVTPAEGLVIYNTTISHLCVYQGGNWVKINNSPM